MQRILLGVDLEPSDAEALMRLMVEGRATDGQVGGALIGLAAKGCSGAELAAFARVLRKACRQVDAKHPNLVDTCGTGGGKPTFNISTAAAIIAAAAGAKVAKHGNRGVTSVCGSADVLEALGARISTEPEQALHMLDAVGVAFFFAPDYHPALKNVGRVRRELGVRTVFNQLGPLANPAGAARQVIGVFDATLMRPLAEALVELSTERALIVHGKDGLDEISPCDATDFIRVWRGELHEGSLSPADFGISSLPEAAVASGGSPEQNAAILREAVSDPASSRSLAVIPSASAALWMAGVAESIAHGSELAKNAVASGAAAEKLLQFIEASQSP